MTVQFKMGLWRPLGVNGDKSAAVMIQYQSSSESELPVLRVAQSAAGYKAGGVTRTLLSHPAGTFRSARRLRLLHAAHTLL